MSADALVPINIVFAGEGPDMTFVETETPDGKGVSLGEWVDLGNGLSALRVMVPASEVNAS